MARLGRQRAFVLLIVVSMVSILSILAVTFTMIARVERHVSSNYVDMVRAKMLATAGVDAAMLRLRTDGSVRMYDAATDPWFYAGTYVAGLPQPATKLDDADWPSYRRGTLTVDGQNRGYSGSLAGTYTQLGDTYALKISDLAGRININGQETNLAGMLNALGRGINSLDGKPDPIRGRGAAIITTRNVQFGGTFKAMDDLLAIFTVAEMNVLRDYISIYSWTDKGVIEPRPQSPGQWPVENYDFVPPANYPGRHPVNVNTAPLPVVFACLTGLSARIVRGNSLVNVPAIGDPQAVLVARAIGTARQTTPFKTWEGFESWVDTALNMISQDQRGVINANANPNTRLNKFVADAVGAVGNTPFGRTADKTDLTFHTTEFAFSSYGWFQIESLGRVLDQNNNTVATAKLRTVVKLFDVLRHTSQRDFLTASQSTGTWNGVRSFPESMEDQTWNLNEASVVDGQIQIREDDALDGNEIFNMDNDDTLAAKLHPNQVHERWYGNIHDQNRTVVRQDLVENDPADYGYPNVPNQNPRARSVMNANLPAANRNSTWGSDLFPDGHMLNRRRNKVVLYPGVDSHNGNGFVNPQQSAFQWWMKQDMRGGTFDGWYCQAVPGSRERIPSGPGGGHDIYGYFFATPWVNGGHCSYVTSGVVLPQCRKANIVYPFGSDYIWLDYNPFGGLIPPPGQWNQIRVELDNYTIIRLYLNGRLIRTSTAWFTSVTYNATNILDITEFGYLFLHSYMPSFDWIYWSDGLIDTIRIYNAFSGGLNHPSRYPVSQGGSYYQGSFDFNNTVLPVGASARLLNIGYTQIRPRVINRNGSYQNIANPPYVAMEFKAPAGAWTSGGVVGDGAAINDTVASGQKLDYRLRFYDNGLTPNNVAAYADDVTVFYTTGPQIMSWSFDPQ